ncbi:MAG: glutathione S-transferase family protein [Alphaproteobacteria bacterium]|nr:glutathione S-transferase family protein [Alphaproteobacteria bacterium]
MYKLIGLPRTRAFRVVWMLEELGAEYEIDPAAPRSEEARSYNPSAKVPILQAGDDFIIDSVAIIQFLADKHGRFTFPAGSIARAQQDSWTQFAMDDIESPLWFNAKNTFILPEELRSQTAMKACRYDFDRALATLETRLGQKTYLMGDEFTVPDILMGHCANWAQKGANWELPAGPALDYFDRVRDRPAYHRAIEVRGRYEG